MCFVDRVLFFRNTSIEKFSLNCSSSVDTSRVYGWLSTALLHRVQHLDLIIPTGTLSLPDFPFTCRTLVTLKLGYDLLLNVPNDVYLPNLKTLHLKTITFPDDNSFQRLFSGCIGLEEMIMESCSLHNIRKFSVSRHSLKRLSLYYLIFNSTKLWIVIDTPMLVHFQYLTCEAAQYALKMSSLVSAHIGGILQPLDYYEADFTTVFSGISNAQSLTLESNILKVLLSCESVPVFSNLVQLKIIGSGMPEDCFYLVMGKGHANVLRDSPQLRDLDFFEEVVYYLPEQVHSSLSDIKEIEISRCNNFDSKTMAKYFLKYAGMLKKLTLSLLFFDKKDKLKMKKELLALPRTSKQCRIKVFWY
ncbi:hypothetical protein PTKIN_Ptkin18bG0134100 [Pterospermum kingtungense]